jgi:hypothetical protein
MTACSDSDSIARTISFSSPGKTSTIWSMVFAAEDVCSLPNTRLPVAAAYSASRMVSKSRSSPTSTTSDSSRRTDRSAAEKGWVWTLTSRWFIRHLREWWTSHFTCPLLR